MLSRSRITCRQLRPTTRGNCIYELIAKYRPSEFQIIAEFQQIDSLQLVMICSIRLWAIEGEEGWDLLLQIRLSIVLTYLTLTTRVSLAILVSLPWISTWQYYLIDDHPAVSAGSSRTARFRSLIYNIANYKFSPPRGFSSSSF